MADYGISCGSPHMYLLIITMLLNGKVVHVASTACKKCFHLIDPGGFKGWHLWVTSVAGWLSDQQELPVQGTWCCQCTSATSRTWCHTSGSTPPILPQLISQLPSFPALHCLQHMGCTGAKGTTN